MRLFGPKDPRRPALGFRQYPIRLRVMQIVKAVYLRNIYLKWILKFPYKPLVPRHMKGVKIRSSVGSQLLIKRPAELVLSSIILSVHAIFKSLSLFYSSM